MKFIKMTSRVIKLKPLSTSCLYSMVALLMASLVITGCSNTAAQNETKVLVFSKTEGFRHNSIETGVAAMKKLGKNHGFQVDATEDAAKFDENNLKQYDAVIFLNTTGNVLNEEQELAFKNYIQSGKGFVGIHAATDTEYEWPWYGKMVGAYFDSHPEVQEATLNVIDKNHPSTAFLPDQWTRTDEWYNFKNINPNTNVLMKIDEDSYEGGKNGDNHPMAWYHDYDGGRAFYTELGHTKKAFGDEDYLKHVLGGIEYALGNHTLIK